MLQNTILDTIFQQKSLELTYFDFIVIVIYKLTKN